MRKFFVCLPVVLLSGFAAVGASAQPRPQARPAAPARPTPAPAPARTEGPKAIGKFDDWIAATNVEAGQTVCYAFTRAQSSQPSMPGRGDVVLTVTERTTPRDAVAISAGFAYTPNATVAVSVEGTIFDFYTAQRSAFARDGHAAIVDFQRGSKVIAKSPSPKGVPVSDTFSLSGFSAAYAAIVKACPAK